MIAGDRARGIALFIAINLVFVIGVAMGGFFLPPQSWVPMKPGFNLVAALTYMSQFFHGGGWLGMTALQRTFATSPESFFNIRSLATRTYSDLGAFHLVVAGALNYFATARLYDLMAGNPEMTAGSPGGSTESKTAGGNAEAREGA